MPGTPVIPRPPPLISRIHRFPAAISHAFALRTAPSHTPLLHIDVVPAVQDTDLPLLCHAGCFEDQERAGMVEPAAADRAGRGCWAAVPDVQRPRATALLDLGAAERVPPLLPTPPR